MYLVCSHEKLFDQRMIMNRSEKPTNNYMITILVGYVIIKSSEIPPLPATQWRNCEVQWRTHPSQQNREAFLEAYSAHKIERTRGLLIQYALSDMDKRLTSAAPAVLIAPHSESPLRPAANKFSPASVFTLRLNGMKISYCI